MDLDDPKTWEIPMGWLSHPDSDPVEELEMLRRVSLMLSGRKHSYSVWLGTDEPGCRCVEIRKNGFDYAELHVVPGETAHSPLRYALFLGQFEEYFQTEQSVVQWFCNAPSTTPPRPHDGFLATRLPSPPRPPPPATT